MKTLIKLLIASSLITVIAFSFLTLNPEKDFVKPATADIFSLTGTDSENGFSNAVEALGMHPRAYDFNGNLMYFGNARIHQSESAEETANVVQEQLVFAGVNKKNYMNSTPLLALDLKNKTISPKKEKQITEYQSAMLAGEVVPTRKEKNVYEMSGVLGIGSIDKLNSKMKKLGKNKINKNVLSDALSGYRYIEVRQEDNSQTAEILAIWSDDFVAGKMKNQQGVKQSPPDPEIPACVGCKRVHRVSALDKNEPYNANSWISTTNIDSTYNFYVRSMKARGWKVSQTQEMINKLSLLPEVSAIPGRGLAMEKNGRVANITILPTQNGGSEIFSLEKYRNAQSSLKKLQHKQTSFLEKLSNRK